MDDTLQWLEKRIDAYKSKLTDLEAAVRVIRQELGVGNAPDQLLATDIRATGALDRHLMGEHSYEVSKEVQLTGSSSGSPRSTGEMAGLRIAEAAERVLADRAGQWVDYKEIPKEATKRGFQNRSRNEKSLRDSFYHTMHRNSTKFEWSGTKVRLKQ